MSFAHQCKQLLIGLKAFSYEIHMSIIYVVQTIIYLGDCMHQYQWIYFLLASIGIVSKWTTTVPDVFMYELLTVSWKMTHYYCKEGYLYVHTCTWCDMNIHKDVWRCFDRWRSSMTTITLLTGHWWVATNMIRWKSTSTWLKTPTLMTSLTMGYGCLSWTPLQEILFFNLHREVLWINTSICVIHTYE